MLRPSPASVDSDSLQTDVMRFMAIIAFCLIAILALVRNSEPPTPALSAADAPEPLTQPDPEPAPVEPAAAIAATPASKPAAKTAPGARRPPPLASPPAAGGAPPGLSLRFASDGDFLHLVARGEIQVYAHKGRDVLSLHRNLRFLECPPPGQVYELMPETIPALVTAALGTQRSNAAGYAWAIRIPQRLEQQIRAFVDRGETGLLVINRHGEIQHVAET